MAGQDEMDQKERTRRKILQVARRIFARSGFEGASVDAIVRTSGLSKGALYWHFPGKLELDREIMHEEMRVIMEHFRIPEAMKGNIDPVSFLIGKGRSLIDDLTRKLNASRQASITQELTEIIGSADALNKKEE